MPPRTTKSTTAKTPKRSVVRKTTKPVVHPVSTQRSAHRGKRTYQFAVGRRKGAVARVRYHHDGEAGITVNERTLTHYFPLLETQQLIAGPLTVTHQTGRITVKVAGGGTQGQAEAVRLGIARTLVAMDPDLRLVLKRAGYLRRDPRVKERKKYGLRRARRAPQWQKR